MGNTHLIEFHLIEIVIFHLIESFNNESFTFYHLIELFHMFSVDRKFKITQNDIIKTFDQVPKNNLRILAVDRKF